MTMAYVAIVRKDPDSHFGVSFPDFLGCVTAGRTLDETKNMALEALSGHIEVMRDSNGSWASPPRRPAIPNSLKRVNHQALGKARQWVNKFGAAGPFLL